MSEHAISALVRKRAEITGEIEQAKEHLSLLRQSVAHIDGALSLLGYEHAKEVRPTYRGQRGIFKSGELTRLIFDLLRQHGPQTAHQLRDAIAVHKGVSLDNRRVVRVIHRKLLKALARQDERGTVTTSDGKVWALTQIAD